MRVRHGSTVVTNVPVQTRLRRNGPSFLTLAQTAIDQRFAMPYRKTFPFRGRFVTPRQRLITSRVHPSGMIDLGVDGWLLPADAAKLYELAYFCGGDVLELGAYRGLSATVIDMAITDSGRQSVLVSIDLDEEAVTRSAAALASSANCERIFFFRDDARSAVLNLADIKRSFAFAFVDHSHAYRHVFETCQVLHRVVALGGFALFHDFNDPRNALESDRDYGVYQGVMDGLHGDRWAFWGIFGCTGLFRRVGPC